MPARTGQEYINGLKERPREVWIDGERVEDVTTHPALRNGVKSVAALYDMQHDPELREEMTYASPSSGDPVGLSFLIPKSVEDLERRRNMMAKWAWASCGMMGRSPDFLNVIFTAWAGASEYFAQDRPEFKKNVTGYYEYIRENDLTLTHALLNLQRRRASASIDTLSDDVALTTVKETDAGVIVHGSRLLATLGPISDEIAIYHAGNHRVDADGMRHSFCFSIPCDPPGIKFLCRESFDQGRSHFNHPLGSRFEEMDATIFFDNVLVPWERVFLLGSVELCNNIGSGTQSAAHSGHQVLTRCLVKAEFILGLADLIVETLGSGSNPHVQENVAELITSRDMLKACLRASEADATLNQFGVMSPAIAPLQAGRTLFGRSVYPRMVEIIQLLGTSSLMALPTEADMTGPLAAEIERYLETDTASAEERVRLFRLAWDTCCSAFGSRQVLYERFFQGDAQRNAIILNNVTDTTPMTEMVQEFLEQG